MLKALPKTIILDVDGVIFDSNLLKENNIRQAASQLLQGEALDDFVHRFTSQNGVTRQTKIAAQFGVDTSDYQLVLDTYEKLNETSLYEVSFTENAKEVIAELSNTCRLIALSGGEEREVRKLFEIKGITAFFDKICGGPKGKKEHLDELKIEGDVWFFGDSKMDFESAKHIGARFIFLFGYTQMKDWKVFFSDKEEVSVSDNLATFFRLKNT